MDKDKRLKLLLQDWQILGKEYMDLQRKYNKDIKISKELPLILKKHEKDIETLIACVNLLGEKIDSQSLKLTNGGETDGKKTN